MKNLENYGVQGLNANEIKQTDGGTWAPGWFWPAAVATFLYNTVADWEENVAAFQEGYQSGVEVATP